VLRPAASLWLFLPPRRRREEFAVRYDGEASLAHVVQAAGIPLTEVGALAVDGAPAAPSDRLTDGASVAIEPVARPQRVAEAVGFLLDVHLGALARRLRLLGIDTAYQRDAEDDELVRLAADQRRVLLTKDRGLLMRRALWVGGYVRGDRPAEQLVDVLDRFAPPLAPRSRCLSCNGELVAVPKEAVLGALRPGTRRSYHRFTRCVRCGRVYWRGAHSPGLDAMVAAARRAPSLGEHGPGVIAEAGE
jgi:uncharacterized protein